MCMVDDGDRCVRLEDAWHVARKEHHCGECGRSIAIGERYHRYCGISDHYRFTAKTCAQCHHAAGWLTRVCNGYVFEGVLEDLREHENEMASVRGNGLAWLVEGMRSGWRVANGELRDPDAVARVAKRGSQRVIDAGAAA